MGEKDTQDESGHLQVQTASLPTRSGSSHDPSRPSSSNRRDGVVIRATASQSVDLGSFPQVESYQNTF